MSSKFAGPLMGVGVSVLCSILGVGLAQLKGGSVAIAAIQVHVAAAVVLLVAIWVRLNEKNPR